MTFDYTWWLWGVALLLQNAAFTWTSRSRNSDSIREHAIASLFSNGTYFFNLVIGVDKIVDARKSHSMLFLVLTVAWYTVWTMTGAVWTHHLLLARKRATGRG